MNNLQSSEFHAWTLTIQDRMELVLDGLLPSADIAPQRLHQAMRYATIGGGKRVRALLAHAAGELCGANPQKVDIAAASVELIHAYSLVHDDMPCMDNDDTRRGKPSCHKQYDDATALLVGDALQSLAFQNLASPGLCSSKKHQLEMLHILATASGSRGMAGGQAIDLASVGKTLNQLELEHMHIHKTGALIRAAALLGARCSDDAETEFSMRRTQAIDDYAQSIGLAFQVVDDILDTEADSATLGKTAGKDAQSNKPTYVTILGLSHAKQLAHELYESATASVSSYGPNAARLVQLARFITQRSF